MHGRKACTNLLRTGHCRRGESCSYCHRHERDESMARPAQSRRERAARQAEVGAAVQLPLMSLSSERVHLVTGYIADIAADGSCSIILNNGNGTVLIPASVAVSFALPPYQPSMRHRFGSQETSGFVPIFDGLQTGVIGAAAASSRASGVSLLSAAGAALAPVLRKAQQAWKGFQTQCAQLWQKLQLTFESDTCCVCLQPLAPDDAPAAILLPCNHMCMHWSCFEHFRSSSGAPFQCPICRKTVTRALNTGGSP